MPRNDNVLQFEFERQPTRTIMHCTGKVDLDSWAEFSLKIRDLIREGKPIRVDLANVTQVDATGIAAVVSVGAAAKKHDCDLKFINLHNGIEDVAVITKGQNIFEEKETGRTSDSMSA